MGLKHMKIYIIFGNNKDTEELIEHLRGKDNGMIVVIDQDLKGKLTKFKDIIYVDENYVDSVQNMNTPLVYYHHIPIMHRKDIRKWRRSLSRER
jgi:hypothetical protein